MYFKQRNFLICSFVVLFFALSISCSKLSPLDSPENSYSSIAAHVKFMEPRLSATAFDSLILTIKGKDVNTVKQKLTLEGTKAKAHIKVPADVELTATVAAFKDSMQVMQGDDTFSVKAGKTFPLTIKMDFLVPTIILFPPDSVISKGEKITLYLAARSVVDMATFGAQVQFDPSILQVEELGREDDFLTSKAGNVNQLLFTQDNEKGTIDVVLGIFPASKCVSGGGNVGRIVFTTISSGTTDLSIHIEHDKNSNYALFDKNADLMYAMGLGGRITVQ